MSLSTSVKIKLVNLPALILSLFILIGSVLLVLSQTQLPPLIPLWYSRVWGESRLSTPETLWLIPFLIFGVLVINYLVAIFLVSKQPVLARILIWTATFVSFGLLYSLYKIVSTVG